jgi:DNA repair photolyase
VKVIKKLHDLGFHVEAMLAPILPQDSTYLAEVLECAVERIFVKNFNETGKIGNLVRHEVLEIIQLHKWDFILTEEHAQVAVAAFADVLGKERVSRDQQEFLALSFYGGEVVA